MRRVGLRFVKGRFVPCDPDDRRATIVTMFDAEGRSLMRDVEGRWTVSPGAYSNPLGPSPDEVKAWLQEARR